MDDFEFLIKDAQADFSGWDLSFLEDRLKMSPLGWSYPTKARLLSRNASSVLDMGTGGGEFFQPWLHSKDLRLQQKHMNRIFQLRKNVLNLWE